MNRMSTRLSRPIRVVSLAVLALAVLPACRAQSDSVSIVARWNGGELERSDYDNWLTFHELADSPESIKERVFVQSLATEAVDRGIEDDPATRLELEGLKQKVLLPALRRYVLSEIAVDDDEIEGLVRDNPGAYSHPRKLRLRNIFKRVEDEGQASIVRRRMEEIHAQLMAGADFKELARRESESQTRFRDGQLGFIVPEELPPTIAAAVSGLQPGQISGVIEHDGGLTIMLCEEAREARQPTPEEVKSKIRTTLVRQRGERQWNKYQQELYAAAAPKISPNAADYVLEVEGYRLKSDDLPLVAGMRVSNQELQEFTEPEIERLLRSWAVGELGVRRAVDLGLDHDPATVAALKWGRMGTLAHLELVRLVDERLKEPTEEEIRNAFESQSNRYREPMAFDLAVIHFAASGGAEQEETIRHAATVVSSIDDGEISFEEAARHHSIHASAAEGGYLGWLAKGQIAKFGPTAANAIRTMTPGQSSGLLRLESGLWLIKVIGVRDPRPLPFDAVHDRIRNDLRKKEIRRLERVVREEHLANIDLQISADAVQG